MRPDCFHIPKDFQSRPEFRWIETESNMAIACAVLLVLWRELAYLSDCQRIGFIRSEQINRVVDREFKRDGASRFEADPMGCLLRSQMLAECEGGFECRPFIALNRHMAPENAANGEKGGFFGGLKMQKRKFEREAQEQAAKFDRANFLKPDGLAMDEDEFRRVLMLVKLIDNQYGRPARTPKEYTPGLVGDAWRAVKKHDEAMINGVCFWLSKKRNDHDSGLPIRTEEALRDFEQLIIAYGRIGLKKRDREKRRSKGISHDWRHSSALAGRAD